MFPVIEDVKLWWLHYNALLKINKSVTTRHWRHFENKFSPPCGSVWHQFATRPFFLHAAETNFGRSARSRSVLTLHKIRQIDCGWEAFISSFAGALTWHLSAALARHYFHPGKGQARTRWPSQVFGLFTLFKHQPSWSTLGQLIRPHGSSTMNAQGLRWWIKAQTNPVIWQNKDIWTGAATPRHTKRCWQRVRLKRPIYSATFSPSAKSDRASSELVPNLKPVLCVWGFSFSCLNTSWFAKPRERLETRCCSLPLLWCPKTVLMLQGIISVRRVTLSNTLTPSNLSNIA